MFSPRFAASPAPTFGNDFVTGQSWVNICCMSAPDDFTDLRAALYMGSQS